MMNRDLIETAKKEAHRFIDRVRAYEKRLKSEENRMTISGSREGGALRRASMDLTRALADLRRTP